MGDLRSSFDASVEASGLIQPVDAALVETGRKIADQIDYAVDNLTGQELTKALYLTPHLVNILREMLATPAARKTANISDQEPTRGKLAQLRSVQDGSRKAAR